VRQSTHQGNRESDARKNKKHNRDIRLSGLARTQTSAVSEHANEMQHCPIWKEVKFIDRDPHWYTRRVKEAIHKRLHPNNINRDSGIDIPEAWKPMIKKHNSQSTTSGPVREQHLIVGIIMRIKMHQ